MEKINKIHLRKFGRMLISRPAAKEAFLAFQAYSAQALNKKKPVLLDFAGVDVLAPSWLDEFSTQLTHTGFEIQYGKSRNSSVVQTLSTLRKIKEESRQKHPWRECPLGRHWTREHPRTRKSGRVEDVDAHCKDNPSRKDSIYSDELQHIAGSHFDELNLTISRNPLTFPHGSDFDRIVEGWTRYWNEIFKPADPLDPNLVKALIATESGFDVKPKRRGRASPAVGLMQLLPKTLTILGNVRGELRDHLVHLTREQALDPNANIAAGIRWLFWKKRLATGRLGREANWYEAVAEYKRYLPDMVSGKDPDPEQMRKFRGYYEALRARKQ